MTTGDCLRTQTSGAVAALCAAFLILYLATVHSAHVAEPESGAAIDKAATNAAHLSSRHVPTLGGGMELSGMDCPFPGLLAPRIEGSSDVIPMLIWWLPVPILVAAAQRVGPTSSRPRYPTGPTRQAVLQRFTL